jgi:hypothetical protein
MPTPNKVLGPTAGAGIDFTTAAAAASYFNALNFTAPMVLGVASGGQVADTSAVVFSGWTGGSSTNTLTITPVAGQGFRDNANVLTNALRYNAANGAALFNHNATGSQYAFGDNVIVDGLQLSTDITGTNLITLGSNSVLRNSIALNNGPSAAYCLSTAGTNGTIENSILNNKGSGGGVQLQHSGWTITSSLIISTGATGTYGIRAGYSTYSPLIKNTAIFNFTTDTDPSTVAASGSTNNATDKSAFNPSSFGTAGQTSITSAEWTSVTSGSEDFRVASGSTKLKNNGATVGPTVGIRANSRSAPYTIGPDQYAAAGGTPSGTISYTEANDTSAITANVAAPAAGTITTGAFKNNTGSVLASLTALTVTVLNASTLAFVKTFTSQTTNGGGVMAITDALFVSGTQYAVVTTNASGTLGVEKYTAA